MNRRTRVLPVLAAVLACVALPQPAWADVPRIPNGRSCLPPPVASAGTVPWAQQQLAPQRIWSLTRGAGVTVAVVDTGVDGGAVQLSGRVQPGLDVRGPGNSPANTDCFGHGTFVAGIIGAAPVGGTMFAGVAPEATILPIRIADDATDTTAAMLAKGIRTAVDRGARVVNVSASSPLKDGDMEAAVAYAVARDVLVVASAGNSAEEGNPTPYPASFESVMAVGATDQTGKRASFSDTGSYLDLAAPGVDVCSIGPGGPGQWEASGTSYAAPFVSGVAALVRAYRPGLTAAQVKHRLEATADRPPANVPDAAFGWGTVNPAAAVTAVLPEEGPAGAAQAPIPPGAHAVPAPVRDRISGVLVALSVLGVILVGAVAVLSVRLVPIGMRRRWRPARSVEVLPAEE
ncbi:type VII secretion-associated serine protease mycosin [Lentzea sp. BCCO 10_0798]|uniref:Type VII secretion-associated serine protease mycosin n=1 Tax=Lentzea kristufekii TaxID=3095430 RepID=A0ABU4U6E7_9PSEU|nr:type VII secretion-associated serine protease mycosin [Lentzea sp. BCCO 10_0798]MDX8056152.1 type VII secretion-associated serine protease mycosin [Lentzea sp. BCCO 10_0798]